MTTTPKLFTVGYEGRTLAQLVRTLADSGVERVVDVRQRPFSRIKGFSATPLFEALRKVGIAYEHIEGLGNPIEIRSLFHEGRLDEGRKRYRRLLSNGRAQWVERLVALARVQPTAILCREKQSDDCHRSVIAEVASEQSKLAVVHL